MAVIDDCRVCRNSPGGSTGVFGKWFNVVKVALVCKTILTDIGLDRTELGESAGLFGKLLSGVGLIGSNRSKYGRTRRVFHWYGGSAGVVRK